MIFTEESCLAQSFVFRFSPEAHCPTLTNVSATLLLCATVRTSSDLGGGQASPPGFGFPLGCLKRMILCHRGHMVVTVVGADIPQQMSRLSALLENQGMTSRELAEEGPGLSSRLVLLLCTNSFPGTHPRCPPSLLLHGSCHLPA